MKINFKKQYPDALEPKYQTEGASGMDLHAYLPEWSRNHGFRMDPGERFAIDTGISISIPEGFEGQIRSRSGLAAHHGMFVLNSPGTIDSDFTGTIKVILLNTNAFDSGHSFYIKHNDRIAQLVIAPVQKVELIEVAELTDTVRGKGEFGSTGVK